MRGIFAVFLLCLGIWTAAQADDLTLLGVGTTKTAAAGCSFPSTSATILSRYTAQANVYSDAGVTPAVNGANVEQWNDQSASGIHLIPLGSIAAPIFGTTSFNGHPGITFTGSSNSGLVATNGSTERPYILNSSTFSTVVLFTMPDSVGGFVFGLVGGSTDNAYDNTNSFTLAPNNGAAQASIYANSANVGNGGSVFTYAYNTPQSIGAVFNSTNVNAYVALAVQGSGTSWTTNIGNGTAGIVMGTYDIVGDDGASFDGTVGEVDSFSGALSGGDLTSLQTYYTCAWGTH